MFRHDNTDGYTQSELDALNAELLKRMADAGIQPGSDEAHVLEKEFANEVSRR